MREKRQEELEYGVAMTPKWGHAFLVLNEKNTYMNEELVKIPWTGNQYEAYRKASLQKMIRNNPDERIGICTIKRRKDGSVHFCDFEEMPDR